MKLALFQQIVERTSLELCPGLTCQDLSRKRSSFLLKAKSN